jgi:hypothetical protein
MDDEALEPDEQQFLGEKEGRNEDTKDVQMGSDNKEDRPLQPSFKTEKVET